MRWRLVKGFLANAQGETVEEGQTVEFKESLSSGRRQEGIQTLDAFANSDGGRVFFGVCDDGTVKGVQVVGKTLEDLANEIGMHSYPSVQPYIEQIDVNGKHVVMVEVVKDTPPVVGVSLCSGDPIAPGKPVDAEGLQAFRRVGRTNQRENFMRIRREQRTDPKLRVSIRPGTYLADLTGSVWTEEGSATAHNVTFSMFPELSQTDDIYADLPYPYSRQSATPSIGFMFKRSFSFRNVRFTNSPPSSITVVATYKDDWGMTWESTRRLGLDNKQCVVGGGDFRRHIVRFPSKSEL